MALAAVSRRILIVAVLLAGAGIVAAATAWVLLAGNDGDSLSASQWRRLAAEIAESRAEGGPAEIVPVLAGSVPPSEDANGAAAPDAPPADMSERTESPVPGSVPSPPAPGRRLAPVLPSPEQLATQLTEYRSRRSKSILELQRFRTTQTASVRDQTGREGQARLINLNPWVNRWYVLELSWAGAGATESYHLGNPLPERQDLRLSAGYVDGLLLVSTAGEDPCPLWDGTGGDLRAAVSSGYPYRLLCGGRVVLRRQATGQKTRMERITDFLRDNVPGGEQVTVFVRENFFQDAYLKTSALSADPAAPMKDVDAGPRPARVEPAMEGSGISPAGLGLPVAADARLLEIGRWYPIRDVADVYLSAIRPDAVAADITESYRQRVGPIDEVEARALVYLVAFDLSRFEVAFAMGTDHPRLGWSERVPEARRVPGLPGPDGIDSTRPLVSTGMVPPFDLARVTAAFTGGFKRSHGAFKYGERAEQNLGSHYGMVESGTVFSKLQPGLATLYVLEDGSVDLKTWREADDETSLTVAFARQNGVPIIERGPEPGTSVPGADLMRFGAGNWSGSQEGRYRTLRAAACLLEEPSARYLVYGYFTSATPSAMARVFQAYDCRYAMLLDMNALEHTYLALYRPSAGSLAVSHLIDEMRVLDRQEGGSTLPRFIAFADNRDFFYLLRKPIPSEAAIPSEADR